MDLFEQWNPNWQMLERQPEVTKLATKRQNSLLDWFQFRELGLLLYFGVRRNSDPFV